MKVKLAGTWTGSYSYELTNPQATLAPPPVPFVMRLTEGWFGRFSGEVEDVGENAVPGIATVKGSTMGPRIRFDKLIPDLWGLDKEGKPRRVRDLVAEVWNDEPVGSLPRHLVRYKGALVEGGSAYAGTWKLEIGALRLKSGRYGPPSRSTGTWTMQKC
jgi:hypothetical protein